MKKNNKIKMNSEIFRLAAVLYADNNYELNPKTIHRKIIESIFINNENEFVGIHTIIDTIKKNYNLDFTFEEIFEIISDTKNFNTSPCRNEEIKITLTPKRFATLDAKVSHNNLDYFINEFHKVNGEYKEEDLRAVIYKFLYDIFQTNVTSFSKLISPNIQILDLININDYDLTPLQTEIINAFLNWDNDEKNKAIFDISSLALEYCLITNKRGNGFKLENLRNKNFYLDTNVIFRAIGLNGENRKNRSLTFLEKFKEANENLFISKFTYEEINKTLTYHIQQINRFSSAKINSAVYSNFSKNEDFLDFYHKWRKDRKNDSTELFSSYIITLIEDLKRKFNIKNDFKDHFDFSETAIEKDILDKASEINTFKSSNKNSSSYIESNINDAKNIYLIEVLRNGHFTNIFDCKYYFISSDQYLRKWDYLKNSAVPIVLLPSQWLSILLRYLNRTSDDFKSFVSFLNLNTPERGISNEKLQLILSGISEITTDFTHQNNIISEMINLKFKGILDTANSEREVIDNSKVFAKTKLENDIENLQKQNNALSNKFDSYQENTSTALHKLQQIKDSETNEKNKEIEKNNKILIDLINTKARLDFNKFKSKAFYFIPIALFCLLYFFLLFAYQKHSWNMVAVYTNYANSLPEGSMQKEFCKWLWLLPGSILVFAFVFIFNRLINPETKKKKFEELREEWQNKLTQ